MYKRASRFRQALARRGDRDTGGRNLVMSDSYRPVPNKTASVRRLDQNAALLQRKAQEEYEALKTDSRTPSIIEGSPQSTSGKKMKSKLPTSFLASIEKKKETIEKSRRYVIKQMTKMKESNKAKFFR